MRFESYADAFFTFARGGNLSNVGVELERSGKREADGVVELHGEVGELQFGAEQVLPGLEGFRAAFDGLLFERAAEFNLGQAFTLQGIAGLNLGLSGFAMRLHDQQAVVNLVDAQGDRVFGLVRFAAAGGEFGGGNVVGGLNFEQFGERLRERVPLVTKVRPP